MSNFQKDQLLENLSLNPVFARVKGSKKMDPEGPFCTHER